MDLRISVAGPATAGELESLADWLRGDPEFAGRVQPVGPVPREGELGVLADTLGIAVGSGGALTVLASSLKVWLSHPRRSGLRIRIRRLDGETVEIDAERVDADHIEAVLRQALQVGEQEQRES